MGSCGRFHLGTESQDGQILLPSEDWLAASHSASWCGWLNSIRKGQEEPCRSEERKWKVSTQIDRILSPGFQFAFDSYQPPVVLRDCLDAGVRTSDFSSSVFVIFSQLICAAFLWAFKCQHSYSV